MPAYHTGMDDTPTPLSPLDPRFLRVLRWKGTITAVVLLVVALGVETVFYRTDLPNGIVLAVAVALGLWLAIVAPPRRYAHWRFALTDAELHVAHGWWVRVHTIVPVARVQHIDLTQGPVERMCGVATLVLHTAGTEHAKVVVPGLARDRAEAVRDRIRAAIEASPW
ncbi:PH domain-containing protein [Sphingomonas sp. VNH70]